MLSETSVADMSFDTTPKETSSILQSYILTLLPSPTETALSATLLKEQFLKKAELPLKSTPSPAIFEK